MKDIFERGETKANWIEKVKATGQHTRQKGTGWSQSRKTR
jgi:hypothetical protein